MDVFLSNVSNSLMNDEIWSRFFDTQIPKKRMCNHRDGNMGDCVCTCVCVYLKGLVFFTLINTTGDHDVYFKEIGTDKTT